MDLCLTLIEDLCYRLSNKVFYTLSSVCSVQSQGVLDYRCLYVCLRVIYYLVMFVYMCLCLHIQTHSAQREQVRRYLTFTIHYTPHFASDTILTYCTIKQFRTFRKLQFNLLYVVLCPLQPQPCQGGPQLTREKHLLLQSLLDRYHN